MGFKKIDAREIKTSSSKEPKVTIGKGRIYFNSSAMRNIGFDTKRVGVHIDKENKLLAVEPAKASDETAFRLAGGRSKKEDSHRTSLSRLLNSKEFVSEIAEIGGYDPYENRSFKPEWNSEKKWLIIDLKEPVDSMQN